ncbi:ArnT family glycosyltransferase [Actinophytocola sediminis]
MVADLPFMHHPDEPTNLRVVDKMVVNGDPNPHFFNYPSLFLYLHSAVHLDGPLLGWLPGLGELAPVTAATSSGTPLTGVGFAPTTGSVVLHRLVTVACGVGVVVAGWFTARRVAGGVVAPAVTSVVLACSPTLVAHSKLVTPDMVAALLVGVGVLCAVWVFQRGSWVSYLVAGSVVGLAAGAKYTAVLVAVPVVVAAVLGKRRAGWYRLPVAGVVAVGAFLLSTPFALLDREAFLAGLEFERAHYATGHHGMEGDTVEFYLELLASREWALLGLAVAGLVALAITMRDRWPVAVILLAFPVVYGVAVGLQTVRNDRTIMLILPPLAVLAAFLVERLRGRVPITVGLAAVVALTSWPATGPTAWARAREWLSARPDTTLLVEAYGPYADPARHRIIGRTRLIDGDVPPGTDYLVAAEGMYGRYLTGDYPAEQAAYERLFAEHRELARFTSDGSTIVILDAR